MRSRLDPDSTQARDGRRVRRSRTLRVLVTVSGWPTHYRSLVPLCWALQAAGHQVRVLCPPSEVDSVGRAGLTAVPVLGGMDVPTRNRMGYVQQAIEGAWPYPWLPMHPLTNEPMSTLDDFDLAAYRRDVEPRIAAAARASGDAAVEFARRWRPDLALFDPQSLEGLLVGHVLGVPAAMSLWGPVGTEEPRHVRILADDVGGCFEAYGLGPLRPALVRHVLDYCPPALRPPTRADRVPVRFLPYNGPGRLRPWTMRPPRRPRVVVVWSTALSAMSGPASYLLPAVVAGLADPGVEVVLTATSRDVAAVGAVPPNVTVVENVPVQHLVGGAAALVHHGGGGSTMTGIWAGVPQLTLTCAAEQTANGTRVAAAGAGRHLFADEVTPAAVGTAVAALVGEPAYRHRAAQLRAELHRVPTPAQAVPTLEALAA